MTLRGLNASDRLAHVACHRQDAWQWRLHVFQGASQVADLAPQLTREGIHVRTRGAGAALFGPANAELLDLTFEVAHPVLQSVALATRGGRVCLRVGQLVAQPRELL